MAFTLPLRCGLVLAGLAASPLAAQDPVPHAPAPFTLWGTAALLDPGDGLGAIALTTQVRRVVISARLAAWDDPCDASDCWPNGDIGLVAGYGSRAGGKWHAWAGAGLAYGFDDNANYLSIPVQAEVAWRPVVFLGIGLLGYAGLSSGGSGSESRSFGGVSLAVQLGKVR